METVSKPTTEPQPQINHHDRKLGRKMSSSVTSSSSFRLRSKSLNSVRLRRVFDLFDKNSDGVITSDEISQALYLLGLESSDPSDLHSIVASFIKPGHSGLDFDDFESLHKSLNDTFFDCQDHLDNHDHDHLDNDDDDDEVVVESDLNEAFKVFDENGDGYISAKELQAVLSKLGLPEAQQEIHRIELMISSVDRNSDGRVDFTEFKDMMLRSLLLPSS